MTLTIEEVTKAVEAHFGGSVVSIERQSRWRPTWYADVSRNGVDHPLVVRGDRFDAQAYPLRHEFIFHSSMEERGFLVPRLHGYIDSIDAILMDRVPGKPDFDGVSEVDRDTVVDEYLQQMVRLHQCDPAPFIEAGISQTVSGEGRSGAGDGNATGQLEERYARANPNPDAFMTFCLGWLHRHPPSLRGRAAPCISDTGQFHHVDGHLVAVLDLEFGHVGDPMHDLAVWRMRDTLIPFGNMVKLYDRYAELTGQEVDLEAIKRHHFAGCLGNELMFGPAVTNPQSDTDLMNYMQWNSETNLMATEFLAEELGLELPEVEMPSPRISRQDRTTFDHLVGSLRRHQAPDEELRHALRLDFRMARHLARRAEIGAALDEANLDDLHRFLDRRPEDLEAGERELEAFVHADADVGRHDEALVALFHRRNVRTHMALGPKGSSMTRHYRCQRFDGTPVEVIQY